MSENTIAVWDSHTYAVTDAAVITDGDFVCLTSAGRVSPAAVATGLRLIGLADIAGGGSVTGNSGGTVTVQVRFFRAGEVVIADNDTTDAVDAAGEIVYLFDTHTVSDDATGTSIAGVCVGFKGTKVVFVPQGFTVDTDTVT